MTRQGSTLVIRDKPSSGCIRRPLSSAGSGFRSALRKTRGLGEEDDASAICVETDDIVDHGHDTRSAEEIQCWRLTLLSSLASQRVRQVKSTT